MKGSKQALQQSFMACSKSDANSSALPGNQERIQKALSMPLGVPTPSFVSKGLTYGLMLACALSTTFWLMRIAQLPGIPAQPANGISKGMALYSNQDANSAYALFGSKPLATENIYLCGVVITSKNPDGTLDGFAIFEIDGKPTNAISVGETIGKGLSLQSIGDETATLLYQGQKLNFKLNKNKDKSSSKSDNSKK
ncbi:hypothetical protein AOC21_01715 [Polynucleobacter sp. VK25]|uniref:hypothetical protein n=1 Tax=Polynucleobacter sp. VK25 TaxID=1758398 RepID=UPI001BFDBC71|nr:hypothetical protein [Polynucleobacter sp. VK25]QWD68653.1 hypothetical protein AOC21_01715 [Polynucleobacter sp. VK25]